MYSNLRKIVYRSIIKKTVNETALEINIIQPSDLGSYTLVAENDFDNKSLSFTLNLIGIILSNCLCVCYNKVLDISQLQFNLFDSTKIS